MAHPWADIKRILSPKPSESFLFSLTEVVSVIMDLLPLFSVVSLLLCMLVSEVSGLNAWDRATVVCETVGKKQ